MRTMKQSRMQTRFRFSTVNRLFVASLLMVLSFLAQESFARKCDKNKTGDLADCAAFLRKSYDSTEDKKSFSKEFDEICQTNSKFKCTKVTVMGNLDKTYNEYKEDPDHKGATIFKISFEDGKYLYLFERKGK